jgi:hypothetical protein
VDGYAGTRGGAGRQERAKQAEADAQGRRLGAELALGQHLGSWDGSQKKARFIVGWVMTGLAISSGLFIYLPLRASPAGGASTGVLGVIVILLVIGVSLLRMPGNTRYASLHHYDGGLAEVTDGRVCVVRWAGLASMSLRVVQGYDDESIVACVLRDHPGNEVTADGRFGPGTCDLVVRRAEQVLTGRLLGPLTGRLDAGLPVTVGCLTVDQSGISCQGSKAGGSWNVSWQEARGIETQLSGHRVTVRTGRWGAGKRAAMAGQPNDFLIGYVLEHAARRAGVSFTAQ